MSDLFRKINTLLKSNLNDVIGERKSGEAPRRSFVAGKGIDREIGVLRQRINDAVAHENRLEAHVQAVHEEIARFDQKADEAVRQGSEAQARYLIDQMQRAKQRLRLAEADLAEHQLVTQELIQRVNLLEAAVAENKAQQAVEPSPSGAILEQPVQVLSEVLKETREKITSLIEASPPLPVQEESPSSVLDGEPPAHDPTIEDDLEARRQRLSKR